MTRAGERSETLLSTVALVVAISDPDSGHTISGRQVALIAGALRLASILLFSDSQSLSESRTCCQLHC